MAGPKVRRDICDAVARSFTVQFEPGVVVRPRPKPSCLRRHRTLVQTVLQVQAQSGDASGREDLSVGQPVSLCDRARNRAAYAGTGR